MSHQSFPETNSYKVYVDYFRKNDIKTVKDELEAHRDTLHSVFNVLYEYEKSLPRSFKKIHPIDNQGDDQIKVVEIMKLIEKTLSENQQSLMEKAIEEGDVYKVNYLISQKLVNIHSTILKNDSFLTYAIKKGELEVANELIKLGADPNFLDQNGQTPIHLLLSTKQIPYRIPGTMTLLLSHGADINGLDSKGRNPLYLAVELQESDIVDLILKIGGDPTIKTKEGSNAFLNACCLGQKEMANQMIPAFDSASVLEQTNHLGQTPLHLAVLSENHELVEFLINHGFDVHALDKQGRTPLFYACENGNLSILETLLTNTASLSQRDSKGTLPLMAAAKANKGYLVEYLFNFVNPGMDIFTIFQLDMKEAQSLLILLSAQGLNATINKLLQANVPIDSVDEFGMTALHHACYQGFAETVQVLIDNGADVNLQDQEGQTPLIKSIIFGAEEVVSKLVENGADLNLKDHLGLSVLHYYFAGGAISGNILGAIFHPDLLNEFVESLPMESNMKNDVLLTFSGQATSLDPQMVKDEMIKGAKILVWKRVENSWDQPIDEHLKLEIQNYYQDLTPVPDLIQFSALNRTGYEELQTNRMEGSTTLNFETSQKPDSFQAKWLKIDQEVRQLALKKQPLTVDYLCEMNRRLGGPGALRGENEEICAGGKLLKTYYPGFLVKEKIIDCVKWLEEEIGLCQQNKGNPIEIAARVYQRLISIHPFNDANGRVGRLVMDYVLQRFQLPPAALGKKTNAAIFVFQPRKENPTSAVKMVFDGLAKTNEILKIK